MLVKVGMAPTISQVVEVRHLLLSAAIYLRSAIFFFRLSMKCCAPSCVSISPDLSGTSAFWHSVLSSSPLRLGHHWFVHGRSFYTLAFSRISSISFDA